MLYPANGVYLPKQGGLKPLNQVDQPEVSHDVLREESVMKVTWNDQNNLIEDIHIYEVELADEDDQDMSMVVAAPPTDFKFRHQKQNDPLYYL